jgi:uncharacterized protein YbjQ (UPF0145 family)
VCGEQSAAVANHTPSPNATRHGHNGLQSLFGGNITIYTNLCEQARSETYRLMCEHAEQQGANAIISMRYDATELMAGLTEVLCYGTAVIVEREPPGASP